MSSINSVSSSTNAYQTDTQTPWRKRAMDFKALQSALQSGNLSGAQQAFATLQKDMPSVSQTSSTSSTAASTTASSQVTNPFQALQSALSSGNLPAAQQAFAAMQQSMQNAAGVQGGHHHHHHGGSVDSSSQTASSTSSSTSAQTLSNALNVLA